MNNNGMNFDPVTGQPLNNNGISTANNMQTPNPQINASVAQPVQNVQPTMQQNYQPANSNNPVSPESFRQDPNLVNAVPTVEQNIESFINNSQAISSEKAQQSKKGINYLLVIILFLVIFAAIFFAFPILKDYI